MGTRMGTGLEGRRSEMVVFEISDIRYLFDSILSLDSTGEMVFYFWLAYLRLAH